MRKYILKCLICFLLISGSAGCGQEPFPKTKLEPVRKFSLGTAKFTPFKKRPTAKELYKTTLRLYDSFDTIAATAECNSQQVNEWSEVDGKAEDIKIEKSRFMNELRAVEPDKMLSIVIDDEAWVSVENGKTSLWYFPTKHSYLMGKIVYRQHRHAAVWAGLLPPMGKSEIAFSSMKLLPDQKINGTDVYVLELRIPSFKDRYGFSIPETRKIYLGKNDLLPRKTMSIEKRPSEETALGLPNNIDTSVFLGFEVNSKLPKGLFPTHPPKGARPFSEAKTTN